MERKRVALMFNSDDKLSKSRTHQSFRAEADINNIMARYQRTGLLIDPTVRATRVARYGDYSNVDFNQALNVVTQVRSDFMALPADVRAKFHNDPAVLIDFMADPKNAEECVKIGILPKEILPAGSPAGVGKTKEQIDAEAKKAEAAKAASAGASGT